ncbi:Arc family DNA-binding protein [Pseudomonas fluorescens]|uniref:Arc family DNA-binding protein n=1 Tax=Pseudomonas fluorescens TaxID=294 RepID=UPI001782FA50|nr:Arc family DNA-binding protein [Pseudomonas fluorescens]
MDDDQILPAYSLRISKGLRTRLKVASEVSNRSMNAEITARLEASFAVGADLPSVALSASPALLSAARNHLHAMITQASLLLQRMDALERLDRDL